MRRLGLAVLAAGFVVGPAWAGGAPAAITGDVSLGVGATATDTHIDLYPTGSLSNSHTNSLLNGSGRVNIPLDDRWNFEFEATTQTAWRSGVSVSGIGTSGHLWAKLPDGALGAFGGLSTANDPGVCAYSCGNTFNGQLGSATAGVEAERYFGNLTLGAQASMSWNRLDPATLPSPTADFTSWQLRGYADYYFTPDDALSAEVKYTSVPQSAAIVPDQHIWEVVGRAEHRFAGTPFSIWASGSYAADVDRALEIAAVTTHTWSALLGVRLFMDPPGSTVQGHARSIPFDYDNGTGMIWDVYHNVP